MSSVFTFFMPMRSSNQRHGNSIREVEKNRYQQRRLKTKKTQQRRRNERGVKEHFTQLATSSTTVSRVSPIVRGRRGT